eukprot:scaffold61211_cov76-Cyclotella_meneghiniana.AAC.3
MQYLILDFILSTTSTVSTSKYGRSVSTEQYPPHVVAKRKKIRSWDPVIRLVGEGWCFGLAAVVADSSSFADEFEWIEEMASSIVHCCFDYFASSRRRHRNHLSSHYLQRDYLVKNPFFLMFTM